MSATGMPERITRWSPEQRAATAARRRTVRWLWENALVDHRAIQAAMGGRHNATVDLQASGAQPRWWLHAYDIAANRRHLEGEFYKPGTIKRPPIVPPIQVVSVVPTPKRDVVAWIYTNSTETAAAVQRWAGGRTRAPIMASRPRGNCKWAMWALDSVHPDATGRPASPGRPRREDV